MNKPGDSSEQRKAEDILLEIVSDSIGKPLHEYRHKIEDSWLQVDGASDDNTVLCEAWAHIGKPKPAQKNKVMSDALKLLYVEKLLEKTVHRKILIFADDDAASEFQGRSWRAKCLKKFNIEVLVVNIPEQLRSEILTAQKRQYR